MNKQAICSFANKRGRYVDMLARLSNSLRHNFSGDFLSWISEQALGCPLHSEVPFAFKIHGIQRAKDAGYEQVLWLDSSVYAIANIDCTFDEIRKDGIIFQEAGHYLRTYTNDRTLQYFGIDFDKAAELPMIGNAGFLGFDFTNPIGVEFFERWKKSMEDGMFNDQSEPIADERFKRHTWDMSCSSAIMHKMGLAHLMKSGNEWLQYAGPFDKTHNETIIYKAQGM